MTVTKERIRRRVDRHDHPGNQLNTAKPKILCIDDDLDITGAIEIALRGFDVELSCRFNGQQGIWTSISEKPDLIITDWLMPEGGGDDVVTTLKRNRDTADIPIIVLSCLAGERMRHRLFSMGVADYLQKPLSHYQLLEAIGKYIDLPPSRQA